MCRRAVLYRFTAFLGVLADFLFSYKVDKTDLSGVSVNFYQTTRRHLPGESGLYIRHYEVVFCKNEYSPIIHVPYGFSDYGISIADLQLCTAQCTWHLSQSTDALQSCCLEVWEVVHG